PVVSVAITALFIANTINVGADLSGMADAAEMLTRLSSHVWIFIFAIGISIATIHLRYHQIANTLKWLALVLFAYVISGVLVCTVWTMTLRDTFIPSVPSCRQGWQMVVAILCTTISPYLFFWQASQEVEQEKSEGKNTLGKRV